MQSVTPTTTDTFDFIRFVFTLLFFGTLLAGAYLVRNHNRLFGPSAGGNSSERSYSAMQAYVIWAHAVALTGAFAFLLH